MNTIVQRESEFRELTRGQQGRYFTPITYSGEDIYFSTQWGNNGIDNNRDCNNINCVINFAKEQGYDIEVLDENLSITEIPFESNIKNIILRGNISKIFGELITLIEEDKRDKLEVTLPYSKQSFKIPSNLYIIGTMNSTDKSIALIDIALRRRFTFLKMKPNVELVPEDSQKLFRKLNSYIFKTLGEDYQIGHSYFMGAYDLDFILEYKIKPLLEEYFYGDDKGLKEVLDLITND